MAVQLVCVIFCDVQITKVFVVLQYLIEHISNHRDSFHALITIAKTDGIFALQKGLVPALWYQMFMNGVRLGSYSTINNSGITKNNKGELIWHRSVLAGAVSGCLGAAVGSPFYLVMIILFYINNMYEP